MGAKVAPAASSPADMPSTLGALWTPFGQCKTLNEDAGCCTCKEAELLTSAWRESVDDEEKFLGDPVFADASVASTTASRCTAPALQVPLEFDSIQLNEPSEATRTPSTPQEQQRLLRACLRAFTRALLRGTRVGVLLDDGCTLEAEASLDSELTHLVLHMEGVQCPVALRAISNIYSPEDVRAGAVCIRNAFFLHGGCSTLVLRDEQFLSMVFDTSRQRAYFETCLKVLILVKSQTLCTGDLAGDNAAVSCKELCEGGGPVPQAIAKREASRLSAEAEPRLESPRTDFT